MLNSKRNIIQIILTTIAVSLIITGIILGDNNTIFRKAIFICMECIGIG